jgi:hypothetical protein
LTEWRLWWGREGGGSLLENGRVGGGGVGFGSFGGGGVGGGGGGGDFGGGFGGGGSSWFLCTVVTRVFR